MLCANFSIRPIIRVCIIKLVCIPDIRCVGALSSITNHIILTSTNILLLVEKVVHWYAPASAQV